MQLDLFGHEPTALSNNCEGHTKHCSMCKQTLPLSMFTTMLKTGTGKQFYQAYCRSCSAKRSRNTKIARKSAPPVTDECQCCGKPFSEVVKKNIHMDHSEETGLFRGWLCMQCNVGIGYLGDSLEGVLNAVRYLEKTNEQQ